MYDYMDPADVEFFAEKRAVTIVPNFTLAKLYMIGGDVGPFSAAVAVDDVPLWLAVNLKRRQKCRITPPAWMNVEALEATKQAEIDSELFTEMPDEFYVEVSQLLLNVAADDIPRADDVRTLVKDIWDLRMSKLRSSVDLFVKSDSTNAKLNFLTLMELNTVRPFLTQALNEMHLLRENLTGAPTRPDH
ncbi:DNA replication complex GINS protein PSF2-like [Tubulanus polymorphus]|uniref:DNA replication complex GINS protein PSF2-like n=1 Tax=Tubulanus polymorphus TaxID=672921 RepID=UPI003DA2983B